MGTRPGALDPGVVLHLFQGLGLSAKEVESLLYKKSGLIGISGVSNDMRDLLAANEPEAHLAVDYFVYRAAKEIGALVAVFGGIDGLVFTAGIGENSPEIRRRICKASAWLGLELDADANTKRGPRISTAKSKVSTWVIPTNEEIMIARHTGNSLGLDKPAQPTEIRSIDMATIASEEMAPRKHGFCLGRDSGRVSGKKKSTFAISSSRTTNPTRETTPFSRLQQSARRNIWAGLNELFVEERKKGVLDISQIPSSITSHAPATSIEPNEVIVGLQTEAPLKRAIMPNGGFRMVLNALKAYGYEPDPKVVETFSKYRKTHNEAVFDAYTADVGAVEVLTSYWSA